MLYTAMGTLKTESLSKQSVIYLVERGMGRDKMNFQSHTDSTKCLQGTGT